MSDHYAGPERRRVRSSEYEGPERRDADLAFERAVKEATRQATQNVSQIHRRRLVRQTAAATFLVSLLVALIIALVISNSENHLIRSEGRYNCGLVTELTTTLSDFVNSDAALRTSAQRSSPTRRLLRDLGKVLPVGDLIALEQQTAKSSQGYVNYWKYSVAPRLEKLASVNCASRLP